MINSAYQYSSINDIPSEVSPSIKVKEVDLPEFRDNPRVKKVYRNINGVCVYFVPLENKYFIGWNGFKTSRTYGFFNDFNWAVFRANDVYDEYLESSVDFFNPICKRDASKYWKQEAWKKRFLRPWRRSNGSNNG